MKQNILFDGNRIAEITAVTQTTHYQYVAVEQEDIGGVDT